MDKRKLIQAQLRHMKPDMGVFIINRKQTNQCYVAWSNDMKKTMAAYQFKLNAGAFGVNPALQEDWSRLGPNRFAFEVIRVQRYSTNPKKTDYTQDLLELKAQCAQLLTEKGYTFY